jgi:hypothetical protein
LYNCCAISDIERLTNPGDIKGNEGTKEDSSGRTDRLQRDETKQTLGPRREWKGEQEQEQKERNRDFVKKNRGRAKA